MKLIVLLPLTLPRISALLVGFGHALLDYLSPSVQVIFVLALFPLIMNVVQFCLVDQVIKADKEISKDIGEDESGYSRVATRDSDVEATPRGLSVVEARRRGSTHTKHEATSPSVSATISMPSSPLLSTADGNDGSHNSIRHYGSAGLHSVPSLSENGPRNLLVYPDQPDARDNSSEAASSMVSRESASNLGDGLLQVRQRRRSNAPSPDSILPTGCDLANSVLFDNTSPIDDEPPTTAVSAASQLSDEIRREARRSLSPIARALPRGPARDSYDLEEMRP